MSSDDPVDVRTSTPLPDRSRGPLDSPWEGWLALSRYFSVCDRSLPRELTPEARGQALAYLAFRHHHPAHQPPPAAFSGQCARAWRDFRVQSLAPTQKAVLLFVTGAALAMREVQPLEAQALLHEALLLARFTWRPTPAEPARPPSSPPPVWATRTPVGLMPHPTENAPTSIAPPPGSADSPDPSGDPLADAAPAILEPVPERGLDLSQPTHISQILEGLLTWEAVVQELFDWKLGQFSLTGRPALQWMLHRAEPLLIEESQAPQPLPSELLSWWQGHNARA